MSAHPGANPATANAVITAAPTITRRTITWANYTRGRDKRKDVATWKNGGDGFTRRTNGRNGGVVRRLAILLARSPEHKPTLARRAPSYEEVQVIKWHVPITSDVSRARGLFTLVALIVSACDPGYDVTVQVVDANDTPIPGVEVELDCPPSGLANHKHHMAFGMTDSAGRVHSKGIGEVKLDCWIHAPGHKSDSVDVSASCSTKHTHSLFGRCSRLSTTLHVPTKP